jgi:hypothetical protein
MFISMVRDGAPVSAIALPGERLLTMRSLLLRPDTAAFPQHLCCNNRPFRWTGGRFALIPSIFNGLRFRR